MSAFFQMIQAWVASGAARFVGAEKRKCALKRCGKEFEVQLDISDQRYCCRTCANKASGEARYKARIAENLARKAAGRRVRAKAPVRVRLWAEDYEV